MLRPYQKINRRKTRVINVGSVLVGGNNPISVQTMTNTLTTDVNAPITLLVILPTKYLEISPIINTLPQVNIVALWNPIK